MGIVVEKMNSTVSSRDPAKKIGIHGNSKVHNRKEKGEGKREKSSHRRRFSLKLPVKAQIQPSTAAGAKLNGANLQDANLQRAYLRDVDLRHIFLRDPHTMEVRLHHGGEDNNPPSSKVFSYDALNVGLGDIGKIRFAHVAFCFGLAELEEANAAGADKAVGNVIGERIARPIPSISANYELVRRLRPHEPPRKTNSTYPGTVSLHNPNNALSLVPETPDPLTTSMDTCATEYHRNFNQLKATTELLSEQHQTGMNALRLSELLLVLLIICI
ncbi:hypothetical protein KSP39_PZI005197 [Platanthera zijinensis]|uniref:Uncharacterized protein n=1 Tax=Platanthera zijinensis TaxID=2320716 RepID=A0AAP0BRS9_9ASPA